MGPIARYLGKVVPAEPQLWQDPVPPVTHDLIGAGGHRGPQGPDPRLGPDHLAAGLDRVGVSGDVPRHRQARWRQRRAHPPRAAEGLGGEQSVRAGEGAADARGHPEGVQRRAGGREEAGFACRRDRAGRLCRRRAGRQGRRLRRAGALHAGAHGCVAGADRRGSVRRARADVRRLPQLPGPGTPGAGRGAAGRAGADADADGSRVDRAGGRPACPERERRPVRRSASSPHGPGR